MTHFLIQLAIASQVLWAWSGESFKKPSDQELKKQLNSIQYEVTQRDGTEPPFKNKYWDNKAEGIYVDIVSKEPLFSSLDKYKSGTGWPSFTKPLNPKFVRFKEDNSLFSSRTEVRSAVGDSHLGHVFDDGPAPTGKRYCMNSAAMEFIPKEKMEERGYGEYLSLFKSEKVQKSEKKTAVFAGGCFWCMEPPFDKLKGVLSTTSGFAGGRTKNPTYKEVSGGRTGHLEVVQVEYDPTLVNFEKLLDVYLVNVDPFDPRGQFCDKGEPYQTAIFYSNEEERKAAQKLLASIPKKTAVKDHVHIKLLSLKDFFPAEEEHQDYYKKNPIRYKFYRNSCGRDQRLKEIWNK